MLVSFSVDNLFSFKSAQTLRMDAVSHGKDDINLQNIFSVKENAKERLLKSALVFGANASGKSNLISALAIFRDIVLRSQAVLEENASPVRQVIPFLLVEENINQPSSMEVVFYEADIKYRYGLEIQSGVITGEWLYYTPNIRETLLFSREGLELEYNKEGFSEAASFVKNGKIQQTRESVPFASVLASRNGLHSINLINWFNKVGIISGAQEHGYMAFTLELMRNDNNFKGWILKVLKQFQIEDLNIVEVDAPEVEFKLPGSQPELQDLLSSINRFSKNKKSLELVVTKKLNGGKNSLNVEFPLAFESDGTRKLIHLLGPIYDSIKKKRILIIDEIEAKFHSLLTKFLFEIYHENNESRSQIIAAAHDTSLMDTRYFRRDQIWFVNKADDGGSEIYSLVEFKERARKLKDHYGPDYLAGAFGAISLFENFGQIEEAM